MIRRLASSTPDPATIHAGLAHHQEDMIRRCPYLGPSVERGLTQWSAWEAESPADGAALFAMLVDNAEGLREDRRRDGPLVCRNIVLFGPTDQESARAFMDWPAWIARNLYAPVQMMVGRFWIGLKRNDSKGSQMMTPPVSFFTMRHSIASKDGLFLAEKVPGIMAILEKGPRDDGRDVFAGPLGRKFSDPAAVYRELAGVFPNPHPES
jgi:hypothetical protein